MSAATPALLLDVTVMERNIAVMVAHAARVGVALRPHAKCHKSPEIARLLVEAGALGCACATIGEAAAMAAAGLPGILITSPVVSPAGLARLRGLLAQGADIAVVVDSAAAMRLAAEQAAPGRRLPVVVDLDVGVGRTGCASVAEALALAQLVAESPGLHFAGVQAYWGNLQHILGHAERVARIDVQAARVRELLVALRDAGLEPDIVTGGGSGTSWIDPGLGVFTEIQPGSFLFLDSCYSPVSIAPDGNPFQPSLFVAASVVTANHPGRVIVNAGLKALATDSGLPVAVSGAPPGAVFKFMGDEHGALDFAPDLPGPPVGAVIHLLTPHCDPTVNLYAQYNLVRDGQVVGAWPILARGYEN